MNFFSLHNDLIDIIISNLNIKTIIMLKYVDKHLYTIVKNNYKYINIIKQMASNYIKFWWLSKKNKINTNNICIAKTNIIDPENTNHNLNNYIFVYDTYTLTNTTYNYFCTKYLKKQNCIKKLYAKLKYKLFNKPIKYKTKPNQYICLDIHPYTLFQKKIPLSEYSFKILHSTNIYYNNLNIKQILFNNYNY